MASGTAFESDGVDKPPSTSLSRHSIHDLVPEILGEIFIRCLPYPSGPTSFKDAPLLLLHVCRHWRQTARWTPRLWTDVNLTFKIKMPPVTVFQMWLDNSGSLPLKVNLPGYYRDRNQSMEVIELLLDNFHRISELDGSLTPPFATILLRHALPIRAPFMTRLDVDGWDKLPSITDLERIRGCMIVPQLEVCNINTSRFLLSLLSLDPTRLRELYNLWATEAAEFEPMEILTSFINLQRLSLFLHEPVDVSVLNIPSKIPIPSLRYLQIATFTGYNSNVFLKELDVAFIEHLELRHSHEDGSPVGPFLDALTGGNIPPLKSLSLSGYNTTTLQYMPWIRRFTQLEKLTLARGTLEVEALISLTYDGSSSPALWILPALSTLHLKRIKFPWEAMWKLVQSRAPTRDGGGQLSKVTFEACEDLEESHRAAFTTIQEHSDGLIQIEFIDDSRKYPYEY